MKFMSPFILLSFITVLAGCSTFGRPNHIQNSDTRYLAAKSIAPLKMPPGISSAAIKSEYPVSDRSTPNGATNPNLVPPGLFN